MLKKNKSKRSNRKSQVWVTDYTISMLLFLIAALIATKIILNSFSPNTDFPELETDASKISEILLSEGYPVDWDNSSVIRPGLLSGRRLNSTKVVMAMNTSYIGYNKMRPILQTKHDFIVIFRNPKNNISEFNGLYAIGSPSVNVNATDIDFSGVSYNNLVRFTRLVIYGSDILRMEVYSWE